MSFLKYTLLDPKSPLQYGSNSIIFKELKKRFPNTKLKLSDVETFVESHVRPRAIWQSHHPQNLNECHTEPGVMEIYYKQI